jgi:hypothetical protein
MIRTYSEFKKLRTFKDRYYYLRLKGKVGVSTFGFDRYINQKLYTSPRWKDARATVIVRDNGCDLGCTGMELHDRIIVHHMNPITLEDIENDIDELYDPEYLVCTSHRTHEAIHYSDESLLPREPITRRKNDTTPWK